MAGNNEQELKNAGVLKNVPLGAYQKTVDELSQGDVQALKRVFRKLKGAEAQSGEALTSKVNF